AQGPRRDAVAQSSGLSLEHCQPDERPRDVAGGAPAPHIGRAVVRDVDEADAIEIALIALPPLEQRPVRARARAPRHRGVDEYDEPRTCPLDLLDHLALHARGVW